MGRTAQSAAVAAIAVAFFAVIGSPIVPYAKLHDFLSFYTGAWMMSHGDTARLYDVAAQEALQQTLSAGKVPVLAPYIRPPQYAFLIQPLAWLPLQTAFVVWLMAQCLLAFSAWYWALRRFGPDALVYCSFFIPVGSGILNGQDCVVMLWLMLGAWLAAEKGRDALAGALAGLTLFKFHMLLLVPLAMLLRRRWRMLGAYAATGAVQAALALAVVGTAGLRQYVQILGDEKLAALHPSLEMMINVSALARNLSVDWLVVRAALTLAVVAGVVLIPRGASLDRWFWGAAAGSLLITPHTYEYDAAILLVPALLLLFHAPGKGQRIAAALMVIPLPYLMTVLGRPWAVAASASTILFFVAVAHPALLDSLIASFSAAHARMLTGIAGVLPLRVRRMSRG